MNNLFNNSNFLIIRKEQLTNLELNSCFEIIKQNIIDLGIFVSSKDENLWKQSLKTNLIKDKFYLYLIYLNKEIVGFVEVTQTSEDAIIISEVQFDEKIKQTRAILYVINFLCNLKDFNNVNIIEFSIFKNNNMSNKTFSHLGGQVVMETDKTYKYILNKEQVKNYLSKFNM